MLQVCWLILMGGIFGGNWLGHQVNKLEFMRRVRGYTLRHFQGILLSSILAGIVIIAFLVKFRFSFLNFFFLPVILAGYFLGKKMGVLTSVLSILLVIGYILYEKLFFLGSSSLGFEETFNLILWGSFLIVTGGIIGSLADKAKEKIANLKKAYIGILDILLNYLEVADKLTPRSVRVAKLAGEIAEELGLEKHEVENIKAAALLSESQELESSVSLYEQVSEFFESEGLAFLEPLTDREKVLLRTSASLLKELEPILRDYQKHYVEDTLNLEKDLKSVNIGSSIIALADLYDRIIHQIPLRPGLKDYQTLGRIENLAGRVFPRSVVDSFKRVIAAP